MFDARGDREPTERISMKFVESVDYAEGERAGHAIELGQAGQTGALKFAFQVPPDDYDKSESGRVTPTLAMAKASRERREWLRKLRRAAKLVRTNEYAPEECTHAEFCT